MDYLIFLLSPPQGGGGSENLIFTKLIHLLSLDVCMSLDVLCIAMYCKDTTTIHYHRFGMELIQLHKVYKLGEDEVLRLK